MDTKEKRNIEINYGFVLIAFVFGIICNLFSNQFENLLDFKAVNWYIVAFCAICFVYLHFDFSRKVETEYGHPASKKATFIIRCRAVIISGGKMFVVKHFEGATYYALPGGHMDKGEEPMACVKREVKEELNLDIKDPVLKYVYEWKGDNDVQNIEFVFVIKDVFSQADIDVKNGSHAFEIFESRWIGRDEEIDCTVYPKTVLNDFRENNFEFEGVKFISE